MSTSNDRRRQAARKAGGQFCHYCDAPLRKLYDRDSTIDHIVPRSLGGPNTSWNRVNACRECNTAKKSATYEEFTGRTELPESHPFRTTKAFLDAMRQAKERVGDGKPG